MVRTVKQEPTNNGGADDQAASNGGDRDRRILRSRYLAVKCKISERRDDLGSTDTAKFSSIINEVETLHELVTKPREQVADAEALLDIANTLVSSVKAHGTLGVTPSSFVGFLLKEYGQQGDSVEGLISPTLWKDIGVAVSHVFRRAPGCSTMIGPMDIEPKARKISVRRRHERPTQSARPEELDESAAVEKTDTDKNMATMFDILRNNRSVGLENLVLNRNSFAQTVENLFALSFLVKDGRAEIKVDEKGSHLVSPRNAPTADASASGKVAYNHFVFRFDFKDWKLMLDYVGAGEELMPHRFQPNMPSGCQQQSSSSQQPRDKPSEDHPANVPTTPIRKLSRNRGLVLQEQTVPEQSPESENTVVEDSPLCDDAGDSQRSTALRKGKRKLG